MNIDGVIISPKAMEQLRSFQDEDNVLLKSHIKDLYNVAKFITHESVFSSVKEEKPKALLIVESLFNLCESLENLFTTEEE
jgi:hypothetical protein